MFFKAMKYFYEKCNRTFSPTTLRYIHVLSELDKVFDLSKIKSIGEIGGGYGGQAAVLLRFLRGPVDYHIFDLPEPKALAIRFLSRLGYELSFQKHAELDLLISNYAFSELNSSVQQAYFDDVVVKARQVYMVYNHISELFGVDSWSAVELGQKLSESGYEVKIFDENPKTHPQNCVVVANRGVN